MRLHFGGTRTAAKPAGSKPASTGNGVARLRFGGIRTAATPARAKTASGLARLRFGGTRTAATPAGSRAASTGNGVARLRFGAGRRGDAMIGTRLLTGGLVGEFGNGGRGLLGPSAGPRLFTRRSRAAGTGWARFSRRSAWGTRGAVATGSAPRRGTFSASAPRKSPASAAAPRRGTFSGSSPQRRSLITTAPRRGTFSSGSSAKGSFGTGSLGQGVVRHRLVVAGGPSAAARQPEAVPSAVPGGCARCAARRSAAAAGRGARWAAQRAGAVARPPLLVLADRPQAGRRLPMIPASRYRLWVVYAVVAALLISLGARLWYVQVMNSRAYASLAAQDQTQQVVVPPVRGAILDDTGQPLVDNRTALVVSVNIARLSQRSDAHAVLHRLAHLLHMHYKLLSEKVRTCTAGVEPPCWPGSPYQPVPVAQDVSDKVALQIMENRQQFPYITAQVQPVVTYPQPDGANPAQVLGYLQPITAKEIKQRHLTVTGFSGVDLVGQAGLEQQYDRALRGTPGIQRVRVNAQGVVTGTISQTPARAGDDLVTSINAPLQKDVQTILADAIHKAFNAGNRGATSGTAVVMTTRGRVVAMASYPSYNPSVWTGGISKQEFQ